MKVAHHEPWSPTGCHIRGSSIPSILVQLTYTIQVHLLDLGDVGESNNILERYLIFEVFRILFRRHVV